MILPDDAAGTEAGSPTEYTEHTEGRGHFRVLRVFRGRFGLALRSLHAP